MVVVAVALAVLCLRRRRAGIRELKRRDAPSLDDSLPTSALRTSPFHSQVDVGQVPDTAFRGATPTLSSSLLILSVMARLMASLGDLSRARSPMVSEKAHHRADSDTSDFSGELIDCPNEIVCSKLQQTAGRSVSPQQPHVAMTEEVMERLLQTLAQRIDRGPQPQLGEIHSLPPQYRPTS